ncbi:serine hydrolase domain-containing protein [Lysobacter antibioticus]|uniref:Beta-lactamase family protein n=1 Tax=Lysobacter antibioticus TaxID=84531 RepID=A0A0S2FI98_LYSAN|nr:serine hydrolase domain-containing protein [Lysobacter antibioticus]ALN83245.1 beta-lactamase family protein [Lysobacter antibioticus]
MTVAGTLASTLALPLLALATAHAAPRDAADRAALEASTDAIFAEWNRRDSPGCGVAVYRDDAIVFQRGYGMANLELGVPIGPHSVFDIGSTSKQFTAASVLLLAQDGKLSLDDDIRKHLPEMPDYGRRITIRQLLQHTSGLRDYIALLILGGAAFDDQATDAQTLEAIARQRALNFPPGSEHLYSNSGYFLAGQIVERVSGRSLPAFAHERIFAPLGMRDTRFRRDHAELVPGRAMAYARAEASADARTRDSATTYRLDQPHWDQVGDGSVHTTTGDLLRWDRNFYDPKVGSAAMFAQMQQAGVLDDGRRIDYGLGLKMGEYRGLATVRHGGAWGGYRAELLRFPQRHLSVATLCNFAEAQPQRWAERVAELWLGLPPSLAQDRATAQRKSVRLTPTQLQQWTGVYRHAESGDLRKIVHADGRLALHHFDDEFVLRPLGSTEFELGAPSIATLRFHERNRERPRRMTVTANGHGKDYLAVNVAALTPAELQAYAGRYRCDELGRDYEFKLVDGALRQLDPRFPAVALEPLERDRFAQGLLSYRFHRGVDGRIEGVSLDAGRVRDLVCHRL